MNIEEFVNDYLQEHRHDVLLNPYNGLVEFAKALQEKLMDDAVDGEFLYTPYPTIALDDWKDYNFTDFDKVLVIICKKED